MNNNPSQTYQPGNIYHTLTCNLREAATGKTVSIVIPRDDVCEVCLGTGQSWRNDDGTCSKCDSKGIVKYEKRLEVRIPAGVDTGSRLLIVGEGNLEAQQVARGNLYIVMNVVRHELFERKGKDLHSFLTVTEDELKRGGEIIVPTLLENEKRLRLPADTTVGTIFRMAGLGLPSLGGGERGDLFVKVVREPVKYDSANTPGASPGTPSSPSTRKESAVKQFFLNHSKSFIIAAGLLLIVTLIYFGNRQTNPDISSNSNNTNILSQPIAKPTIPLSFAPTPVPPQPVRLRNGANITPPQGPRGYMSIKVINRGSGDIALKVVSNFSRETRRFVYVRSNSTAMIKNLPREVCLLLWETGTDWDAENRRFLTGRALRKFDEIFDLRKTNYEVDFTPSLGGTLHETAIDETDFEESVTVK